jgi:hypothetical protein
MVYMYIGCALYRRGGTDAFRSQPSAPAAACFLPVVGSVRGGCRSDLKRGGQSPAAAVSATIRRAHRKRVFIHRGFPSKDLAWSLPLTASETHSTSKKEAHCTSPERPLLMRRKPRPNLRMAGHPVSQQKLLTRHADGECGQSVRSSVRWSANSCIRAGRRRSTFQLVEFMWC